MFNARIYFYNLVNLYSIFQLIKSNLCLSKRKLCTGNVGNKLKSKKN